MGHLPLTVYLVYQMHIGTHTGNVSASMIGEVTTAPDTTGHVVRPV